MSERESKKPIGADLIIPVTAGGYAVYYVFSVRDFPFEAQLSGLMLASLLGILVLIYFARAIAGVSRGALSLGFGDFFGPPESRLARAGFVGLIIGFIFVVPYLGFTLTTFSFLACSFLIAGVRPVSHALLVAVISAIGGWLFFIVLLSTRFPQGPFERAMGFIF